MSQQKKIFIFFGPPGSGKGTLSQLCVRELGWSQLSTGDLCRQNIAEKTEIGKQIDLIIQSGKLIPDELMIGMVEGWMIKQFESMHVLLLDGFPRTIAQAQAFDEMLEKDLFEDVQVQIVLFSLDDKIIEERLTGRLVCPSKGCGAVYSTKDLHFAPQKEGFCDRCSARLVIRPDDSPAAIKHRLELYHKHANELIAYYRNRGNSMWELEANKPLDELYKDFLALIGCE